ncbi:MAG: tetratricopeptide repeat protein [Gammaproteobacteria bacterium]|nr:tetratricopeptide repeat protein [Gammaproteobacteria bacterium]
MGVHGAMTLQQVLSRPRVDALAEAALWLAHETDPAIDVYHYLQRLQFYAEAVSERLAPRVPLGEILFQLNDYLFNDRGFFADSGTNSPPENSFLHRVIDRRHGTPLTITMIYLTVGRWLGLPLEAVSFPGRILVKYSDPEGDVVIDPAEGGLPLQEHDLSLLISRTYALQHRPRYRLACFLSATDDTMLLVRLLRQLKQAYLLQGDAQSALWALENILLLMPDTPSGFRERGHLYELLECSVAAAEDYSRYLELVPDATDAELLRERLPHLLQQSVTFH